MEDDLKVLLVEYSKLLASNPNNLETPAVIPILLRHGHFSPARLDRWPFPQILSEMDTNLEYLDKIIQAFRELVTLPENICDNPQFNLNEKKGIAFLSATRDKFPRIHDHLKPCISSIPRIHLATIEYVYNGPNYNLSDQFSCVPCPFPQIQTLAPKLNTKYPLLLSFFASPSIEIASIALDRLKVSPEDIESIVVLECAARHLDSKLIYSHILQPIWGTTNEKIALTVLQAISKSKDLEPFCKQAIMDLSNT